MPGKKITVLIPLCTFLFVWLFYKEGIGLNLVLFEVVMLVLQWNRLKAVSVAVGASTGTVFTGLLLSMVAVVWHASAFSIFMNIFTFLFFSVLLAYPQLRSLHCGGFMALNNLLVSWQQFYIQWQRSDVSGFKLRWIIKGIRLVVLPLVVLLVFFAMYRSSSPYFEDYTNRFVAWVGRWMAYLPEIDAEIIFLSVLGLMIVVYVLYSQATSPWVKNDALAQEALLRQRKRRPYIKMNALRDEWKAGMVLFILLNALLCLVNVLDIYWVWFNFTWDGEYLKQFVHSGTYLLLLSILISIGLVLLFFRGNLNFYKHSQPLKILAICWLAQNAVLTISVGVRNLIYIDYFALAYKRIGVLFFLAACLAGLWLVFIKVRSNKSAFYLMRWNSYVVYVILLSMSLVNWDRVIARYNFQHAATSFTHFNFLASLSDKTLPLLDKPLNEMQTIQEAQAETISDAYRYMSPEDYVAHIALRKKRFLDRYACRGWRSFNYADYQAYHRLRSE